MIDKLFIAEKGSLAKEVALAWAEKTGRTAAQSGGRWTVGDDAVVALSGHVYEQAQPEDYEARFSRWSIPDLPIVPRKWMLIPIKDKVGRIKEIKAAIKDSREIVNVGDAGREGQLLVDELLYEAGKDPYGADVQRLWVKSVARKDMLAALSSMFPNVQKKSLYESALARQRADWLHGLNMTRLYTVLARSSGVATDKPLSVGRVQTPTLRIVVDRDREIAKFRAVDHFLPTGTFRHQNGSFRAAWIIPKDYEGTDSEGRLVDKAVAERVLAKVAGKTGPVESYEVKKRVKAPPLPFALSNLQKECSAKFGLTAANTLEVAQSLYEKKVTTYPRTDSQYMPKAILEDEAPGILDNLERTRAHGEIAKAANRALKSQAWNDAKCPEHHAILPTVEATQDRIDELSDLERKVFDLIAKVFVAQFYPDCRWDSTVAVVGVEGERFKGTGRRVTDVGWKAVYGAATVEKDDDEDEDEQSMPAMAKGDPVLVEKAVVESKRTTPPAHFNEGTLIEAMKNIHRFVPDSEIKKKLKETSGIGTEATRSNILETVKKRGFLVPKGKFIVSTPVGQSLIDVLHAKLTDPAMTALWEEQFDRIVRSEMTVDHFLGLLVTELTKTVKALENTTLKIAGAQEPLPGTGDACPKCGAGRLKSSTAVSGPSKGKRFLSCDGYSKDDPNSCRYSKWPEDMVKPLPGDGGACPKCGKGHLRTRVVRTGDKKGDRYLSCDAYDPNVENSCRYAEWSKVEPLPGDGAACPKCGKGRLATRMSKGKERFLSCDNWRKDDPSACDYFDWGRPKVEPLPGDGAVCPKCGKGRLATRMSKGKERFLSCDAWRKDDPSACDYFDWGRPKVEPLPGDGDACPKCGKGHLRTRATKDAKRFQSCDNWRKGDATSCDFVKWDDDGRPPRQQVEPLPGDGDACPKCRKGRLRTRLSQKTGKRFLSCDGWKKDDPKSCSHAIFFDEKGNPEPERARSDARPSSGAARPSTGAARTGLPGRGRPGAARK